jgi:hypothetical protein
VRLEEVRPAPGPDDLKADPPDNGAALSQVLKAIAEDPGAVVSLGSLAAVLEGRAHALALLLLVLPETIPFPVPSISTVIGIPLVLIAGHLVLRGESTSLPPRVGAVKVRTSLVRTVNRWVGPMLIWIEGLSRPRWRNIAERTRLVGLLCLYLAIVLALPLPFVNLAPALCLAVVSLGLIRHDGIYIVLGLAGTIVLTAALVFSALFADSLFQALFVR